MANKPKPPGWSRHIPKTNTGVFKRAGVPFGLFVNLTFACFFIAGWFDQYITGVLVWLAGLYVARLVTDQDDRWWAILIERLQSWLRRVTRNRFRSIKPFLDT